MYVCPVKVGQGSVETTEGNHVTRCLFGFPRLSSFSLPNCSLWARIPIKLTSESCYYQDLGYEKCNGFKKKMLIEKLIASSEISTDYASENTEQILIFLLVNQSITQLLSICNN